MLQFGMSRYVMRVKEELQSNSMWLNDHFYLAFMSSDDGSFIQSETYRIEALL